MFIINVIKIFDNRWLYLKYTLIIPNKVRIKLNATKQLNQKKSKVKTKKYYLFTF